jgi:putative metallohydrolase (TIGR04338 family)
MTDSQRQKVYDAEGFLRLMMEQATATPVTVLGSTVVLPPERKFGRVEDVQRYVDALLGLSWVKATWPRAEIPVLVRSRKGNVKAHYEPWSHTIALCASARLSDAWAMREVVVLHEVAHHLSPSGHGPGFAGTYLRLVEEIVGPEAGFVLTAGYADQGVTWNR